jgi:hypothetical protein
MKVFVSILFCTVLLFGCSKPPTEIKYETKTMDWMKENDAVRMLGLTNHTLIIHFSDKKDILTNVDSLDQAANILGEYGWEFVSSEVNDGTTVYHMKRQASKDGGFDLVPLSVKEFQK